MLVYTRMHYAFKIYKKPKKIDEITKRPGIMGFYLDKLMVVLNIMTLHFSLSVFEFLTSHQKFHNNKTKQFFLTQFEGGIVIFLDLPLICFELK